MSRPHGVPHEDLNAYLDGVLEPEQVRALEARLGSDAALRAELEELRRTVGLLHTIAEEPAPPELRANILDALPRGRRLALPSSVTAAAALAAAVLVAVAIWPRDETTPVKDVAVVEPGTKKERSAKTARDEDTRALIHLEETEAASAAKLGAAVKDARDLDAVMGTPMPGENRRGAPAGPGAKKRGRVGLAREAADGFGFQFAGRRFQKSAARVAYLRRLSAETPEQVRAHIGLSVSAQVIQDDAVEPAAPAPQTYSFASPEEAAEVRSILNRAYAAKEGEAAAADFEQEDDAGDGADELRKQPAPTWQRSAKEKSADAKGGAEVPETERLKRPSGRYEVVLDLTPRQQAQVERWLLLLSVPPRAVSARPGDGVALGSAGKQAPSKDVGLVKEEANGVAGAAPPDAKRQKGKSLKKAVANEVQASRKVRFGLSFPEPAPAAEPSAEERER